MGGARDVQAVFSSDRIDFMPVSEDLIPEYLVMLNDTERVQRYITRHVRQYDEAAEREWVRGKRESHAPIFSMIERATGRFIGNIEYMDRMGDAADLGIAITAAQQDKGFGSEAIRRFLTFGFEQLGLEEVRLNVFDDNPRAFHVYEKCGFTLAGPGREEGDLYMTARRRAAL